MKRTMIGFGMVAIAGIGGSQVRAADLQVVPQQRTTILSDGKRLPKTTAGFIPANLGRSSFPFEGGRNVFGKDDRIPMNSTKYPWSAIGRVEIPISPTSMKICTGTLIGKNLVVTNAHCVVDKETKKITSKKIFFRPNLINGEAPAVALTTRVVSGTNDPDRDRGNDWAFLVLDKPLGETHGWLKFVAADLSDLDSLKNKVFLAGYSSDFPKDKPSETAGVHEGCSIRGFGPKLGMVSHDCDMMAGASGGPMFVLVQEGTELSAVIIALNAAERISPEGKNPRMFSSATANVGVYAAAWASKAEELLKGDR